MSLEKSVAVKHGIGGDNYEDLWRSLVMRDEYMLLADLPSYAAAEQRMVETYGNREQWNRMSLLNIARSGIFSADRSIADYAETIWHVPYKKYIKKESPGGLCFFIQSASHSGQERRM